jgi:glycosyltransferase involved in cell wall biosynthesis
MKINFILNAMGVSGGVKAVFMFSRELKKLGHEVNVIYPLLPLRLSHKNPLQLVKEAGYLALNRWQPKDWYGDVNVIQVLALNDVPDADVSIATQWETAYYVHDYPKSKGCKFNLVQDYEDWYARSNEVTITYNNKSKNIVHSQWLKRVIERYGHVDAVIPHCPDHSQLYPDPVTRDPLFVRVLMCYRRETWKGMVAGVAAYRAVEKPNTKLIMFGLDDCCPFRPDEYYSNPRQDEIRRIYNQSDIFLFPSEREGWGMPPMEAMACGVPVISTAVGAVPEFITPGISGIIVQPKDIQGMTKALNVLIEDKTKRERMGHQGYEAMKKYRWKNSARMLENVLCKL